MDGKTIVIAGGSSGMGLALARKLQGSRLHLIGRNAQKLRAAQTVLGGDVAIHAADIGDEAQVAALAASIGPIDHLVTTTADLSFKPLLELDRDEIARMLGSKLLGPVHLVRHLAPSMSKQGSITFFSGAAAYKAIPGASMVAAANAALDGLTRTLALELAPIRVNVVSPGVVDSPTWDFLPAFDRSSTLAAMGGALPVGRVGNVDELADAALFFMSNGFATGAVLQLDGGANA